MSYKSDTQPLCRCCGKPIRKWTTAVYVFRDTPRYIGDRHVVTGDKDLKSKADCQKHSNQIIVSVDYTVDYENGEPVPSTRRVHHFHEWDGESYDDEFFCCGTCAKDFGILAAKATNLMTKAYAAAIRRRNGKRSAA